MGAPNVPVVLITSIGIAEVAVIVILAEVAKQFVVVEETHATKLTQGVPAV